MIFYRFTRYFHFYIHESPNQRWLSARSRHISLTFWFLRAQMCHIGAQIWHIRARRCHIRAESWHIRA